MVKKSNKKEVVEKKGYRKIGAEKNQQEKNFESILMTLRYVGLFFPGE